MLMFRNYNLGHFALGQQSWSKTFRIGIQPPGNFPGTGLTFVPFHICLLELTSQLVFIDKGEGGMHKQMAETLDWMHVFICPFLHSSTLHPSPKVYQPISCTQHSGHRYKT